MQPEAVFGAVRRGVSAHVPERRPLLVAMDDTVSRKRGRKIPGVAWRRDPMGPHFRTQFVWGRRFLQFSAILPADRQDAPMRAIPIAFEHAPSPKKPSRKDPPEAWVAYRETCRRESLGQQAVRRLSKLREEMDGDPGEKRALWVVADGGYTNKTVLRHLPERTTFIGRIRADAQLYEPPRPREKGAKGRRPLYGETLPTPEEVRQDPQIPWQTALVYAAGKTHEIRYKTVAPVLWRAAGAALPFRLVVIAPLRYRPSLRSKLLYRNPAYLLCTDPSQPPEEIIQAYVGRWDIEVNFRDEKQLIRFDEAQVRTEASARTAPAMAVSAYALLLLAACRTYGVNGHPTSLPLPKWRQKQPRPRVTTSALMNQLRFEMWSQAIERTPFSGFASASTPHTKPEKYLPSLRSVLFYAQPAA